jgi:membrane dipeptidase
MPWFDGHLDLGMIHMAGRDVRRAIDDPAAACISLPALRDAGVDLIFGTIFTEPGAEPDDPCGYPSSDDVVAAESAGMQQLKLYQQWEADGELALVRTVADLDGGATVPRVVLLMEGADPIRNPDAVKWWFDQGLRIVGLSWATGTRYAGGNRTHDGLSAIGEELVAALDQVGMIHDASHLSDPALDQLLARANGPVIASHSNCRALVPESGQRLLRDDQIKSIHVHGGVIGLNLFTKFLAHDRRATITDCINHIEHICHITNTEQCIALGSDMDGGFAPGDLPCDLDAPGRLENLSTALHERGWPANEVEGLQWRNWDRFLRRALPAG